MSRFGLSERTAIEAGIYRRDSLTEIAKQLGTSRKTCQKEYGKIEPLLLS